MVFEDDAGLERAVVPPPPPTWPAQSPPRRQRLLSPTRTALVASALVLAAAAVIVPLRLRTVASLSRASQTFLAHPAVRIALTVSGAGPMNPYSTVVTVSSLGGRPLDAEGVRSDVEISLMRGGNDLADVLVADRALYVRLGIRQIDERERTAGTNRSLASLLDFLSEQGLRLAFVRVLASGGWVRLSPRSSSPLLARLTAGSPATSARPLSGRTSGSLGHALAVSWDEYVSARAHVVSSSETVYSVAVPVRAFLSSLVSNLGGRGGAAATSSLALLGQLEERVSPSLAVPLTLQADDGSLVEAALSVHGLTVRAAISHPAPLAVPAGARAVSSIEVRALLSYLRRLALVRPSAAEARQAESLLRRGLVAAGVSAAHDGGRLFLLLGRSRFSLGRLEPGRMWKQGSAATGSETVSVHVAPNGRSVVFTSYVGMLSSCVGVLDVVARAKAPVLGIAKRKGSYFFVAGRMASSECSARRIGQVRVWSRHGFPSLTGISPRAARVLSRGLPTLPVAVFRGP